MRYREIWKVYGKVFDINTLKALDDLKNDNFIEDEMIPISEGKEAIVFKSGNKAVKIYKVLNISYKDQLRYLKMDNRFKSFPTTQIGIIYIWVKKEFINLRRMYKSLVNVPIPYVYKKNVLVMEYIGDENVYLLHDIIDQIENKEEIWFKILDEYKKIYNKAKLIHGDFSEYNLIYYKNKIFVIDVSQAIPISSPYADELLGRDLRNLENLSRKLGLNFDINMIKEYIGIP